MSLLGKEWVTGILSSTDFDSQWIGLDGLFFFFYLLFYSCILKISAYYSFFLTYYSSFFPYLFIPVILEKNNNAFGHDMVSSLQIHIP